MRNGTKYQQNKNISFLLNYLLQFHLAHRKKKPGESGQLVRKVWMCKRWPLQSSSPMPVQGAGQGRAEHQQRLGRDCSESSPKEDSGLLVDENLEPAAAEQQLCPGLHPQERGQQVRGGRAWFPSDPSPLPGPTCRAAPSLGHQHSKDMDCSHSRGDQKPGAALLWTQGERAGAVQPGEVKALRRPLGPFQCLKGLQKWGPERLSCPSPGTVQGWGGGAWSNLV